MFKLIIIDDEKWSREVIKQLIKYDKYHIELVAEENNGFDGLRAIHTHHPDIVITDMKMPGLNGVELLKRLSLELPDVKTIVMSGFEDVQYLRQAIKSHSIEYLLKPIKEEDINNAVSNCIEEIKRTRRTKLSSKRIFHDESVQRDFNKYLKNLNMTIIKHQTKEAEYVLQALKSFKNDLNDPLILDLVKDSILNQLQQYLLTQNFDFTYEIDAFSCDTLDLLIQQLIQIYHDVLSKITDLNKVKYSGDVQSILDFINQHYMYQIGLNDIADMFYLSNEHVSRLFKKHTGEGITQYILRKKMESAADLILTTDYSMKNIAELMGFENIPYFYKMFKKTYDCSPGDYKEQVLSHPHTKPQSIE
jgi:two-component system, response regulator YesN